MQHITPQQIRASFINASRSEGAKLKRAGQSGRDGNNTVGTLICAEFLCSGNVTTLPHIR